MGRCSTTSPWGRRANNEGLPLHVAELLASLETPTYIERVALSDMKNIMKAKKAIKKALEIQKNGGGFSLVEILSPCPTILKMDPLVARKWVGETLMKTFPLGVFRDRKPELPESAEGSASRPWPRRWAWKMAKASRHRRAAITPAKSP